MLPSLQAQFRIERARMRLRLTTPAFARAALAALLAERGATVEAEVATGAAEAPGASSSGGGGGGGAGGSGASAAAAAAAASLTVQVDPGAFRDLHAFMQSEARGEGRIEVLSFAVTAEGGEGGGGGDYAAALANAAAAAAAPPPPAGPSAGAAAEESGSGGGYYGSYGGAAAAAPARPAAAAPRRAPLGGAGGAADDGAGASGRVVYARGPVAALPDAFASRRERFAELDDLQPGWLVELRERGDSVDAVFFSPDGARAGPFAAARRQALQWKQRQQQQQQQ